MLGLHERLTIIYRKCLFRLHVLSRMKHGKGSVVGVESWQHYRQVRPNLDWATEYITSVLHTTRGDIRVDTADTLEHLHVGDRR